MKIVQEIINLFDFYLINKRLSKIEKRLNASPLFRDDYFGIGEHVVMPNEFYGMKDIKKEE